MDTPTKFHLHKSLYAVSPDPFLQYLVQDSDWKPYVYEDIFEHGAQLHENKICVGGDVVLFIHHNKWMKNWCKQEIKMIRIGNHMGLSAIWKKIARQ